MKKIFTLTSILILTSACATPGLPCSYTVQIDSSFSDNEIAIIEGAMSSWTGLSTDAATFDFQITPAFSQYHVDQVPWGVIVVQKDSLTDIRAKGNSAVGMTETRTILDHIENGDFNLNPKAIGPTILIPSESDLASVYKTDDIDGAFFKTTAHETGHAMGLHHTAAGTVMCQDLDCAASAPTCDDLAQYCSLRPGLKCDCNSN